MNLEKYRQKSFIIMHEKNKFSLHCYNLIEQAKIPCQLLYIFIYLHIYY